MKKTIIRVSCLALLGLLAASCQKEFPVEQPISAEQSYAMYTVRYEHEGTTWQTTMSENTDLEAFMLQLMAVAREGYTITVSGSNASTSVVSSKKTVVFRTQSDVEAAAWSVAMVKQGYTVTITVDEETNEYVCTAVKID